MSAPPPVSVCLLAYNRAERLPATLDSLLAQSYGDFELIVSDDASDDDTAAICREYAAQDARVVYRRNARNPGMPGNLNAALQSARGAYLANLHDGDIYHPDLLACWKSALDAAPTAAFVFNAYQSVRPDGRLQIFRELYPPLVPGRELAARLLSRWDSCVFGTVLARRSAYERLGWFDPSFGNFADVDMWLRMAQQYDAAYVAEPLVELMPRDPTRFYAFVHWQVAFWILGIHTANLARCRTLLPELTARLARRYPARRRRYLGMQMLLCVKHRRWDRVREGLAIWRHADDWRLRWPGRVFGRAPDAPGWYTPGYWGMARLRAGGRA